MTVFLGRTHLHDLTLKVWLFGIYYMRPDSEGHHKRVYLSVGVS